MPVYRMSVFFNQAQTGWSETLYTPSITGSAAATTVTNYLQKRAAMLYTRDYFNGVRLSQVDLSIPGKVKSTRISRMIVPGPNSWPVPGSNVIVPVNGELEESPVTNRPDQVRAALQLACAYGDGRNAQRYLVGIPDLLSGTEPDTYLFLADPVWTARYRAWADLVISQQWSIEAHLTPPGVPIVPVIGLAGGDLAGLWGVIVDSSGGVPAIAQGDRVHLRGFTPRPPAKATPNGQWIVDNIVTAGTPSRTTITLRNSSAVNSLTIKDLGSIQKVAYGLFPIQAIEGVRVGIHKRGRPSLAPRGRRLIRVSLVP